MVDEEWSDLTPAVIYRAITGKPLKIVRLDDGQLVLTPYESDEEMNEAKENARSLHDRIMGVVHSDS